MVMSGGGQGDPRDDDTVAEQAVVVDYSFQNHSEALLRKGRHAGSNFRRTIFDRADLTEGDFTNCDFRRASLVEADLMKSAFDGSDFRGADLRKARLNLSNFRNCRFGRRRPSWHSREVRYLARQRLVECGHGR